MAVTVDENSVALSVVARMGDSFVTSVFYLWA